MRTNIAGPAVAAILAFLAAGGAAAGPVEQDKKQIAFTNKTMADRLRLIRKQLAGGKLDLAEKNIRGMTEQLAEEARLTRRIRAKEPGYTPDPPIDFDATPAAARRAEYAEARRLAIEAGKKLNADAQAANAALLRAKNRQMATIAISALKMTVENAPGRPGGTAGDLVVEAVKKLNGYIMDKTIAQPIARISEAELLEGNFVKIAEAARLLKKIEQARSEVLAFARKMDAAVKTLDRAAQAEQAWQKYAWLREPGAGTLKVQIVDLAARDLELELGGRALTPADKGRVIEIKNPVVVTARMQDKRRKFCVERREYARSHTKTIVVHPGPGGGPEDSLVYSSSRIPAKSSWTIQREAFEWKPSFNSRLEPAPRAVGDAYWKLERDRMHWTLDAEPGRQVNLHVKGGIDWIFERNTRGKRDRKEESHTGSATLVLRLQ